MSTQVVLAGDPVPAGTTLVTPKLVVAEASVVKCGFKVLCLKGSNPPTPSAELKGKAFDLPVNLHPTLISSHERWTTTDIAIEWTNCFFFKFSVLLYVVNLDV